MTASAKAAAAKPVAEREVTLVRVLDAPRELVFRMWTESEHMAQWWGPHGFTNPVCELEPREGGKILIHMRAPDGTTHVMDGIFHAVVPNECIVFTISVDAGGKRLLEGHDVITFEDWGGKTRLTVHAKASGFAEIARMMLDGMEAGWTQSLERLDALTARRTGSLAMKTPNDAELTRRKTLS